MTPLNMGRSADSGATRAATVTSQTTRMSGRRGGGDSARPSEPGKTPTRRGECGERSGDGQKPGKVWPFVARVWPAAVWPTVPVPAAAATAATAPPAPHIRPSSVLVSSIVQGITTKNKRLYHDGTLLLTELSSEARDPRKVWAKVAHTAHAYSGSGVNVWSDHGSALSAEQQRISLSTWGPRPSRPRTRDFAARGQSQRQAA